MNILKMDFCLAMISCLAGCGQHRPEEVSLPNGYALNKTAIEAGVTRFQITRTVVDQKGVIAEWISENGTVLSIMPTPTFGDCEPSPYKTAYFRPYSFGDYDGPVRVELENDAIKINGKSLDQASFVKIVDKLKAFSQGNPVLTITPPVSEAQLIEVLRILTGYAGKGFAMLQHSNGEPEVVDIEALRKMVEMNGDVISRESLRPTDTHSTITTATVISDIEETAKQAAKTAVSGENREASILARLQRMYLKYYEIDAKSTNLLVSVNCGEAIYQVNALIGGEGRITNFVVNMTPIIINP